jgi:hypothetical protein
MTTPITLLATGDISPRREAPERQFAAVRDILRSGDITFGQLESVLSREGTGQLWTGYGQRLAGLPEDPAAAAKILVDDGFDVMSSPPTTRWTAARSAWPPRWRPCAPPASAWWAPA